MREVSGSIPDMSILFLKNCFFSKFIHLVLYKPLPLQLNVLNLEQIQRPRVICGRKVCAPALYPCGLWRGKVKFSHTGYQSAW